MVALTEVDAFMMNSRSRHSVYMYVFLKQK